MTRLVRFVGWKMIVIGGVSALLSRAAAPPRAERSVLLLGKLSDNDVLCLTVGQDTATIVLIDTPKARRGIKSFLAEYHPDRVTRAGRFDDGLSDLEDQLREKIPQLALARADKLVVSPAKPPGLLLQAACLAGSLAVPLTVLTDESGAEAELARQIKARQPRELVAVGSAVPLCQRLLGNQVTALETEEAVAAAYLRRLRETGPINCLVVTNPADRDRALGRLSLLAPRIAVVHHAVLLCTNDTGANTADVVKKALRDPELARADALLFVAGLKAIPTERRPNPVAGKDKDIEMEPLTPTSEEAPFSFATGRLFHDDLGVFMLMQARPRLLAQTTGPRHALIVSNPGGGLELLETFSRNTARELRNAGYHTTARFDEEVTKEEVRRLLPEQDIFLWEGHYRTMVDKFELPRWDEPLRPCLCFLQSCLALNELEGQPLFQRGALAIVGSATRTYSASGGAFTLAFFDALQYDNQSLGGSLRQAKNFLLAYSLLKKKRLGEQAKLGGANLRSAWAFTLWGDPTIKLPHPATPTDALVPVTCRVHGQTITLSLPPEVYPRVKVGEYDAELWPNGRMAGLLTKNGDNNGRRLVPFLFAEVPLPSVPANQQPYLTSRLSSMRWVFCWDGRRNRGYLLVAPRSQEEAELRFHVHWDH